jgi:hypothetical protein
MKLALAGATVLGIVGGFAPVASASSAGDTMHGGCAFNTDEQATLTGGQNVGVIVDRSVTTDANNLPTGATVECWITVNGVKQESTDLVATGIGAQANAKQISFPSSDFDFIELVTCVTYADGSTDPCTPPCDCFYLPLPWILDAINNVFATINAPLIQYVDPAVCPQLAAHAGSYGPIRIAPDGDVYVDDPLGLFAGSPVYDCPPYDNF